MDSAMKIIEKLNEDNYSFWSFQMKCCLKLKEIWYGVIEETPENLFPVQPVEGDAEEDVAFQGRQSQYNEAAVTLSFQRHRNVHQPAECQLDLHDEQRT
jgi:hypothetical protein